MVPVKVKIIPRARFLPSGPKGHVRLFGQPSVDVCSAPWRLDVAGPELSDFYQNSAAAHLRGALAIQQGCRAVCGGTASSQDVRLAGGPGLPHGGPPPWGGGVMEAALGRSMCPGVGLGSAVSDERVVRFGFRLGKFPSDRSCGALGQ